MNKLLMIILFVITAAISAADDIIPQHVYQEGTAKFPAGSDIFRSVKLEDPDAWKAVRDEAVGRLNSIFINATGFSGRADSITAVVYYNDNGRSMRKIIMNQEKLTIGGNTYLVVIRENGMIVTDIKTGYNIEKKKTSR